MVISRWLAVLVLPAVLGFARETRAQSFVSVGAMSTARTMHTATRLGNGNVIVAGGNGFSGSLASAELYNPSTSTWSAAAPLAHGRSFGAATSLSNGFALVVGGKDSNNNAVSSAEVYSPSTNIWSSAGTLATPRFNFTATLLANGTVLVVGGSEGVAGFGYLASAEVYAPTTNTWSSAPSMATPRFGHTATALANGKVLVVGGQSDGAVTATAELYDPLTNTWSATGALTTARQDQTATLLSSGRVLVTGGFNIAQGGSLTSAELYDPTTAIWSAAPSLSFARYRHAASALNDGRVLVAEGYGNGGDNPIVLNAEIYDPIHNTWSAAGSLGVARVFAGVTTLANGEVLFSGGQGSNNIATGSAEAFVPAAPVAAPTPALPRWSILVLVLGLLGCAARRRAAPPVTCDSEQ